ncbi:MAG: methyltransferase domain-containing protein [Candidatus Diapherotrites archaeon]|nr:methyltransferase domain-containing protein [Candidatus Diapherotrites archaeon]
MKKTRPEHQPGFEFRPGEYESPGMKRMQEQLTLRAIELLGIDSGRVIDIGCGTGYSTQVLADTGFDVVGIDPNQEMVERANERKLACSVGSFEEIPFPDHSFDAAVSISTLQWVEDYRAAAKEVSRVLKYSAKAVFQFYPESEEDAMKTAKAFAREGFKAELAIDNPDNPKKKKVFLVLER